MSSDENNLFLNANTFVTHEHTQGVRVFCSGSHSNITSLMDTVVSGKKSYMIAFLQGKVSYHNIH